MIVPSPPTVAVIGCGPGGMFFLHAVETKRRLLEEKGDTEGLSKLPRVTCFDRATQAGGLWRTCEPKDSVDSDTDIDSESDEDVVVEASKSFSQDINTLGAPKKSTNMYEALWTNGAKEFLEFDDYTFDEHFQKSLPIYMPRDAILEYITERVTRNCDDIFKDVMFETTVSHVTYDNELSKFEVNIEKKGRRGNKTLYFDKCIWAAGQNGKPQMPHGMTNLLRRKGYKGEIMHSSAIGDLLLDVKGKSLLMVGDSYSAEDITLQAIKHQAEHVYILSRFCNGACQYVKCWPQNKVTLINGYSLTDVIDDECSLRFQEARLNFGEHSQKLKENGELWDIQNIDAIVFCTGYKSNMNMLDPMLVEPFTTYEKQYFDCIPSNWVMPPNPLSKALDDVSLPTHLYSDSIGIIPGIHRGILIDNPNMMFLTDGNSPMPLFSIDVKANLLLSYITGDLPIASEKDMEQWNTATIMEGMEDPWTRYELDYSYMEKVWHNSESYSDAKVKEELNNSYYKFRLTILARDMIDSMYPFRITKPCGKLNEKGELYLKMFIQESNCRNEMSDDEEWRTFRDDDPSHFISVHTGTTSVPLKKPWMDLADCKSEVI